MIPKDPSRNRDSLVRIPTPGRYARNLNLANTASVARYGAYGLISGSKLYKTIDLKPPETTDPYDPPRAPASLSAEDVFRELTR